MAILKIENGVALFNRGDKYVEIQDIGRDDILSMLAIIYNGDDVIIDSGYDLESVKNPTQKIILRDLITKFQDFESKKSDIKSKIDSVFAEAENQYLDDLKDEEL